MEFVFWLIIMIPCSLFITLIGVYAWTRKKPMWFWSGSTVKEEEIADVRAYNRANGIMWIVFSLPLWASTVAGCFDMMAGGIILMAGCLVGIPGLVIAYRKIYAKYRTKA